MEKTSNIKIKTKDLVETAMMAAVIFIGTQLNIPYYIGSTKSMIHLGTGVLFIVALILGKNKGAISAAVGLSLYDALSPYIMFAPFTFIIKGGMAYIAGAIAFRNGYKGDNLLNNILAFTLAGIFNIFGYFIADTIIYRSAIIASGHIPSSIITTLIGIFVAVPLGKLLKKAVKR